MMSFLKICVLNLSFVFVFSYLHAQSKVDVVTSNLALKDMLAQNPVVEPTDKRDSELKFSDLMAPYLNPGINTVFDEKTDESKTDFSYSTNSCELNETTKSFYLYYCSFAVGYVKSVIVDKYSKIKLDMSVLMSSGVHIQYDYKIKNDDSTKIENATYFIY